MNPIDLFFGGGEKEAAKYQAKGAKALRQSLEQAKQYPTPFYNAGTQALQDYQTTISPAANPTQFYENILGSYNISPAAQRRLKLGLDQLQGRAAATGGLGSGQLRQDMEDYIQEILGADQQQYLHDILGIRGDYLSNLGNLMNYGYGAGTQLLGQTNSIGGANQAYYGARANQALATAGGFNKLLATGLNTAANYATGGLPGVIAPYTSNYYKPNSYQEWRNPDYY